MARVAIAALLVGGGLGFVLGRHLDSRPSRDGDAHDAEDPTHHARSSGARHGGDVDEDPDSDEASDHDVDEGGDEGSRERAERRAAPRPAPSASELARRAEELTRAQATLERRIADARRERTELFGEPLPPRNLNPRFTAAPIADSLRDALDAEGIEGAIEGVDCSEHPCIAYGRLRGDEEDVEELERSSALDAYRDDRLVLLLWATTASETSEGAGASESTPETAIFALAFLPATDDTDAHETVERRIRARVFEVWNADRPDREALEPPAI